MFSPRVSPIQILLVTWQYRSHGPFPARLADEHRVFDPDPVGDGFDHVVHGEGGNAGAGHGLHFHPGLVRDAALALDDRHRRSSHCDVDIHRVERERVAQRDELAGPSVVAIMM
jgi:hypothetical protein